MVAPLVGAWIEILPYVVAVTNTTQSLPSWERGLKFAVEQVKDKEEPSLPSWERGLKSHSTPPNLSALGRSPRGSVD